MDAQTPTPAIDAALGQPRLSRRRRRLLTILAVVVVAAALVWGLLHLLFGANRVETDNAYVGAEVAQVTPLIDGPVAKVLVVETQVVKPGQPLVVLDDSDARLAVAEARAALGQAERKVKGYYASDTALGGQVSARNADIVRADADIASASSDLDRARTDLTRRQNLAASGAVSGDELSTAQNRFATAQAALAAARASRIQALANRTAAIGTREVNAANISGVAPDQNPEVAAAQARLAVAELTLRRTVLRAPIAGVVSKRQVQVGQRIEAGNAIMSIVPVDRAYVDANFKEVQLEKVRPGQPAVLTSDLYGGGVKFHGRVRGLSGGTGAAFSLIPAQNASGNWIKVVQRLPVRIDLDPAELRRHPLRVGLSMKAVIDTSAH